MDNWSLIELIGKWRKREQIEVKNSLNFPSLGVEILMLKSYWLLILPRFSLFT